MHTFSEYVNPFLGKLLRNVGLDKHFIRGQGCYLYDSDGNGYLDCLAAYGALPFGHNPKEIWDCIVEFQNSAEPNFIQPSCLNAAGELAKRLVEVLPGGLQYVTFTNSGAETVEAAIKLCRSATGRMGILAAKNSFHGKTLGALSATGKHSYQAAFGAPVEGFHHVDYGDIHALAAELEARPDTYAALILEPIQGEGGIIEPPAGYLREAKDICTRYGVKLIADEIQTGLCRTGTLLACDQEGVYPDVLLLAKALGGGIMPIGACVCTRETYNEDFALKHSSTFAGNSLACRVGIKVLDILTGEKSHLPERVKSNGEFLKTGLSALQKKYPHLIKSVRGRGLMLGVEFGIDSGSFPQSMLGIMADMELLTPMISSYLLNCEHLRVAPTLNGSSVIRIEPPLVITREECKLALERMENMLQVLNSRNSARFLSFLIKEPRDRIYAEVPPRYECRTVPPEDQSAGRFAFLIHPLDYQNYTEFDESLNAFNGEELSKFAAMWNETTGPFVISCMNITSKSGQKAYGEFICVPHTAEELIKLPREEALSKLRAALKLAVKRGAKIVGLGAFTSVVSMGGLYLKHESIPLTTGNSYTVVSAVEALGSALDKLGIQPESTVAAVVGAAGSIGRGCSMLLSEKISRLLLIGNPGNKETTMERLYGVAGEVYKYLAGLIGQKNNFPDGTIGHRLSNFESFPGVDAPLSEFIQFAKAMKGPDSPIVITTAIHEMLPSADLVLSATSSTDKIITAENLKFGAVICDISRPANVSEEILNTRPDIILIDGGVVEVPGLPSLGWNFGFEKGLAYACMAETMMLGLEQHYTHTSLGSSGVNLESILLTRNLADKHGFKLASLRSFNRPLHDDHWDRYKSLKVNCKHL